MLILEAVRELLSPNRKQEFIPSLDGPWAPNDRLDTATIVSDGLDDPKDLIAFGSGRLAVAVGNEVRQLAAAGGGATTLAAFDRPVHAFASLGDDSLVAGLSEKGIVILAGPRKGMAIESAGGRRIACPTAILPLSPDRILVADASIRPNEDFQLDYLEDARTGRIVEIDLASGATRTVAEGLAYPTSLARRDTDILVTEAFGNRVLAFDPATPAASPRVVMDHLPGFPWRIQPIAGGYLLVLLTVRTQLLEFVRSERRFRQQMVATVPREHWIAPAVRTTGHLYEPVQGGQIKHHGFTKPWAPPRSYGLVARLNDAFAVEATWHSRNGGRHHGLCAVALDGADAFVLSRGSGSILSLREDARARAW